MKQRHGAPTPEARANTPTGHATIASARNSMTHVFRLYDKGLLTPHELTDALISLWMGAEAVIKQR